MIMVIAYLVIIVLANLSIAHFGPSSSIINAFVFIGLDLILRDGLHQRWHRRNLWGKMFVLVVAGGVISYILNPATARIAIASSVAMSCAALMDAVVYSKLYRRGWLIKANASNIGGATIDSIIFPILAFGGFPVLIIIGQMAAKILGGAVWSVVLKKRMVRACHVG
jgi:uncharacterized PurR-regulated membrane protein YhhQ (DUF165 family)